MPDITIPSESIQGLTGYAYSKPVTFTIGDEPAKEEGSETASGSPLSWGPETDGFQLAMELTNVPANRLWLPGAELTSKLWIKNASSQSQTFSYFVDFWRRHRWYPELQDQKGARFDLPHPYGDEKLQFPKKTLAAGEVLEIGHFAADLHGLPPGRYTCSDTFRISLHNKDCLLYTSPSPRDQRGSRMPSSA